MTCFILCGVKKECRASGEMQQWCPFLRSETYRFVITAWRGISLLDVVGKVFAKVVQRRLQKVVEEVPDSQRGFRRGRVYIDMIFCARQLVEKAREHNATV